MNDALYMARAQAALKRAGDTESFEHGRGRILFPTPITEIKIAARCDYFICREFNTPTTPKMSVPLATSVIARVHGLSAHSAADVQRGPTSINGPARDEFNNMPRAEKMERAKQLQTFADSILDYGEFPNEGR